MRGFLLRSTGFVAIQTLILLAWLAHDPKDGYLAAISEKPKMAIASGPHDVLLVGGSSVAFGIDAELLRPAFPGAKVLNMGCHAGLGLDFILNQAIASASSGDTIILNLEYEHFVKPTTNAAAIDLLLVAPENVRYFSAADWKQLSEQGLCYFRNSFGRVLMRLMGREERIYCRDAFDSSGGIAGHLITTSQYSDTPTAIQWSFNQGYALAAIEKVNRFANRCRRAGVEVLFAFPTLSTTAYRTNELGLIRLRKSLLAGLEPPVINKLSAESLPDEMFSDTEYHLTADARSIRTTELLHEILEFNASPSRSGSCLPSWHTKWLCRCYDALPLSSRPGATGR